MIPVVKGFLEGDDDDDNITAATDALTTLAGDWSDSESDEDDNAEDFAIENAPRPPPAELMYGGQGKCETPPRVVTMPDAGHQTPAKRRKRRGARGGSTRKKGPRRGDDPIAPKSDLTQIGSSGMRDVSGNGAAVDQEPCVTGDPANPKWSDVQHVPGTGAAVDQGPCESGNPGAPRESDLTQIGRSGVRATWRKSTVAARVEPPAHGPASSRGRAKATLQLQCEATWRQSTVAARVEPQAHGPASSRGRAKATLQLHHGTPHDI